jgi:hypothetical protein
MKERRPVGEVREGVAKSRLRGNTRLFDQVAATDVSDNPFGIFFLADETHNLLDILIISGL